jgi:branched-chain amino acid transport system permease protein
MLQILVNGLVVGSQYALIGLGFALIYGVVRFFHFSHGVVYTVGAYAFYVSASFFELSISLSVIVGLSVAAVAGVLIDRTCYHPLRRSGTNAKGLLLASLGLYVLVQNTISLVFGDETKTVRGSKIVEGLDVLGARVTPSQLAILGTCLVLLALTAWILYRTQIGKEIRAVAGDPALARVVGIDANRVYSITFAWGSVLAGVAAILVSFDTDIYPTMGFQALLMSVVAVVIGGAGSLLGAVIAGLLVGLTQQIGSWAFGTQWQDIFAFSIFIAFLVFRPYGLFGTKLKASRI